MSAEDVARYFDYAASSPPFDDALVAQVHAAKEWFGNPSSAHRIGTAAHAELERLRRLLASQIGFQDGRLVLMSGATEANNWVVHGVMRGHDLARVLVASDAHASVWNACRRYPERMDVLSLDSTGRIGLATLTAAIRTETRLVCCSHVASETGVVHDVAAIAAICERRGILCHVDGAQALGRIPVDLRSIACDFYVFSSHKFGGPRGCGGVFLRSPAAVTLMDGGGQEGGMRPGTEDLPAIAGTVVALEQSIAIMATEAERLRDLTRVVMRELEHSGARFIVNGDPEKSAPGFLSLSFPGLDAHALVADLAVQGFSIASGSACSENRPEPSRAVLALGRSPAEALGTVRITMGRSSDPASVDIFAKALAKTVRRQAEQDGVS